MHKKELFDLVQLFSTADPAVFCALSRPHIEEFARNSSHFREFFRATNFLDRNNLKMPGFAAGGGVFLEDYRKDFSMIFSMFVSNFLVLIAIIPKLLKDK